MGSSEGLRWRGCDEGGVRLCPQFRLGTFLFVLWSPSRSAHCAVHAYHTLLYIFLLSTLSYA